MEWYELALIVFFLVYSVFYLVGSHENRSLARKAYSQLSSTLSSQFPIEEVPFTYISPSAESKYQFKAVLSSPNRSFLYARVTLELKPRHELFSILLNSWLYPVSDVVAVEIPIKADVGSTAKRLAVVRKDWVEGMKKHFEDLVRDMQKANTKVVDFPPLKSTHKVLASSQSLIGLLSGAVVEYISKAGAALDFLYLTDADPVSATYPLTLRLSLTLPSRQLRPILPSAESALALAHNVAKQ